MVCTELALDPKDHPFLLSEPNIHDRAFRVQLTELLFESFQVPALYVVKTAALSSFSSGRSTSLVFDSGAAVTMATPVHDGYVLQKPIVKVDLGGDFITQKLAENLKDIVIRPHYSFHKEINCYIDAGEIQGDPEISLQDRDSPRTTQSYHDFCVQDVLRDIKECHLKVSESSPAEFAYSSHPTITYELPDGSALELGNERFTIPELLFTPNRVLPGFAGVHNMIYDSITRCDMDIRKELYSNVVVTGGNSLFNGFTDRLNKCLSELTTQTLKVKLIAPQSSIERRFSGWLGGSILSSLGSFQQMWMSKLEYEEHGAELVERKCP